MIPITSNPITMLEWLCNFTLIVGCDEAAEMAAHFICFGLIALVSNKGNDSEIIFTLCGNAPAGNSPFWYVPQTLCFTPPY